VCTFCSTEIHSLAAVPFLFLSVLVLFATPQLHLSTKKDGQLPD